MFQHAEDGFALGLFSIDPDPKEAEGDTGAGDQPAFDTIAMRAIEGEAEIARTSGGRPG